MFLFCIDVAQMSRLSSIDSALVRLLGHDFSLVGCHLNTVAKKFVRNSIMEHQHKDKGTSSSTTTAVTTSHSAVVLSVNLFSLMMVRMMSSQPSLDPSQIELVEFLLRVFGHVVQDESTRPKETEAAAHFLCGHKFARNTCMICTRCMFFMPPPCHTSHSTHFR